MMSKATLMLPIILPALAAGQIFARPGWNYIESETNQLLGNYSLQSCTRFAASDEIQQAQYTTLRVHVWEEATDYVNVTSVGHNLSCGENFYAIPLPAAQTKEWQGIWRTCPLINISRSQLTETCSFQCQCKGGCAQIQLSKRPRSSDESSWSLCGLYISYPLKVSGCQSVESGSSGIYQLQVAELGSDQLVYCDMVTDGGGWTVVLLRRDGLVDFVRDWEDYKMGFGSLTGEFWAGNELMHQLTSNGKQYSLRVDIQDYNGTYYFAGYSDFSVASESDGYRLHITGYWQNSSAGDSFAYHDDVKFSTLERDNDVAPHSCAMEFGAPWWFKACHAVFLTGRYGSELEFGEGITWSDPLGYYQFAKYARMMIRPN